MTTAVPARGNRAAAQEPPASADVHDPRAHGWADVQEALITATEIVARSADRLAGRPGDDDAREMLRLALAAQESLGEIARRWVVDQNVLADVDKRAYDRGVADCKAARCRLSSVPGPH